MIFANRQQAAERLAEKLAKYEGDSNAVVIALPRGGVVLAAVIAKELGLPLDLVIPRKIGAPGNTEYAIGAITESGVEVWNEEEKKRADPEWLMLEVGKERAEAARRREKYLSGRVAVPLAEKTVLIVDDGIATGITMKAAIAEVRKQSPKKIIVAVPVAPNGAASEFFVLADEFIVLHSPINFGAVAAFYDEFPQVEDEEVVKLLAKP